MRHDPAGAAIVIMLRSLKMPGMAQAVQDLMEQGAPAFDASVPILSQLLKAEMAEREVRSIAVNGRVKVSQRGAQNVATLGLARLPYKRAPASGRPRFSQSWRLPGCFGP